MAGVWLISGIVGRLGWAGESVRKGESESLGTWKVHQEWMHENGGFSPPIHKPVSQCQPCGSQWPLYLGTPLPCFTMQRGASQLQATGIQEIPVSQSPKQSNSLFKEGSRLNTGGRGGRVMDLESNMDSRNKERGGGGQLEDTAAAGSCLLGTRIAMLYLIRTRNQELAKWLSK